MKNLNTKAMEKFFEVQGGLVQTTERMKNKLKEKKGLDGFVVILILIVAAAVIGVAFYLLAKSNIIDTSTSAFDKIKEVLND